MTEKKDFIEDNRCKVCVHFNKDCDMPGPPNPEGHCGFFEKNLQYDHGYKPKEINWVDVDSWDKAKNCMLDSMKNELIFCGHKNDQIKGKPQLVEETKQTIPVIIKTEKMGNLGEIATKYFFIDESCDRRHFNEVKNLSFDFWIYKVVEKGKEYFLFSEKKIDSEFQTFSGMKIEVNDLSEISKSLKFKKISTIFIVGNVQSSIKILEKKRLIEFCQLLTAKIGFSREGFKNFIFTHPDGKIYNYPDDYSLLKISQTLSGKHEGYPLHIFKMGTTGLGKTYELEAVNSKFKEQEAIFEAGSSRPLGLIPSYKESPAKPGYIMDCIRVGHVDELMKMLYNEARKHHTTEATSFLGDWNYLLEQKERTVAAGTEKMHGHATAKLHISTNPFPKKATLYSHIGDILDPTTAGRMLFWVQDKEEEEFIVNNTPRQNPNTYHRLYASSPGSENCLIKFEGEELDPFITIYDSCQTFLCEYDEEKVREIWEKSIPLIHGPLKRQWQTRGLHHITLLLDGIVKYRCLFDFNSSFKAVNTDYSRLDVLIKKMIKTWETDLREKDEVPEVTFEQA